MQHAVKKQSKTIVTNPMKQTQVALAVTMMLSLSACNESGNNPSPSPDPTPITNPTLDTSKTTATDITAVTNANNSFAIDFYKTQTKKTNNQNAENIFFSPYSLSSALAMTYEGATGETAKQMAKVLHFPDKQILAQGNAGIYNTINDPTQKDFRLNTANALWLQKDFQLKSNYTNRISSYYGGKVSLLDFENDPNNAAKSINNYVEQRTNNKIKNLVNENVVKDAKLILTNAVYFKGAWVKPFEKELTQDGDFNLSNGNKATTKFMKKMEERMGYFENDTLQMIRLPYKGGKLAILVALPKTGTDAKFDNELALATLKTWRNQMQYEKVNLRLPKFKLETAYKLAEDLKSMGMPIAFSDKAEFPQISKEPLAISEVIHKAFVEVNEVGTEAAAATAVAMDTTSAPPSVEEKPKEFNADHPFTIMIEQNNTGNILFMGHINNPAK